MKKLFLRLLSETANISNAESKKKLKSVTALGLSNLDLVSLSETLTAYQHDYCVYCIMGSAFMILFIDDGLTGSVAWSPCGVSG